MLVVAGPLAVWPLYASEGGGGGGYSKPPAVENETVMLAEEGGDGGRGEPSPEGARNVVLV